MRHLHLWPLVLLLTALALLPGTARANAGPPTPELHIRFQSWPAGGGGIIGLQLHACAGEYCDQPTLLIADGRCDFPACLPDTLGRPAQPSAVSVHGPRALTLREDYLLGDVTAGQPRQRMLLLQLEGGATYASLPFTLEGYKAVLDASFNDPVLQLSARPLFPIQYSSLGQMMYSLVFLVCTNLLIELPTAAIIARRCRAPVAAVVAALFAANLLSYPLVWGFFPALTPFAGEQDRALGLGSLVFVVAGASLLTLLPALPGARRPLALGGAAALLSPLLCGGAVLLASALPALAVPALPDLGGNFWLSLSVIELAVVLLEGGLLRRLMGGSLSLRDALGLTLVTNTASFVAGMALLTLLP